jgi:hypothetical protein
VNDGENCIFLAHMRKGPNSRRRKVEKECEDFINQLEHIETNFVKFTSKQRVEN